MTPPPSALMESKTWIPLTSFGEDSSPVRDENRYPDVSKLWPRWHAQAACLGNVDDVLFFGAPRNGKYQPSAIRTAQEICDTCPVFRECLTHALEQRESWGIWASTTMRERQAIFDGLDNGHFSLEEIIRDREEARDERRAKRGQPHR